MLLSKSGGASGRRILLSLFATLLLCITVGCANGVGGGGGVAPPPPPPGESVTLTAQTSMLDEGASTQLTATVTGVANPTLVWDVNGISDGNSTVGTISGISGLTAVYTAPTILPSPNNPIEINASIATDPSVTGSAMETLLAVLDPNIADRFLEQTTFGPTPQLVATVSQNGIPAFLANQFALPVSMYAPPASTETDNSALQQRYWIQLVNVPDQLRQRVAFALSQILVISGDKINTPQAYTPYLNLLETDAFTNYRQIMQDVTLSPAMGHYLDMVNSDKPTAATHADENYARELMQLFTIGEMLINNDGSPQLDSSGNTIPPYSESQIDGFSRAYTGWTYPTMPGATLEKHNPAYWTGPMVPDESNHDETSKQLLTYSGAASGGLLPANQTAEQDLKGALDNVFNHPNVPPFVVTHLIQHLIKSNPSPAYINRVATVFINNGSGVRGDMTAVITAILMDPEARQGDNPAMETPDDGHLQEPILYITGLLRAFGATTDGSNLTGRAAGMEQTPLTPPSVFNFYAPNYVVPGSTLLGPEFQILTTATALSRANFANSFIFGTSLSTGATVSFTTYANQASNPSALLATLNTLLLHGTMPASMQSSILTAMQNVPGGASQSLMQAETAIYLIVTSSQYQVQY